MELKHFFPFFKEETYVYLDSAATAQKPKSVIDAMEDYYFNYCANTHRSSHGLGNKATRMYEESRGEIAAFIGAQSKEIIFTRGTTESINMLASSYVKANFDTVIISELEHHANIIPWQLQGFTLGAGLEVVRVDENMILDRTHFCELLEKHPNSFVSLLHISNVFGIVNPVKELTSLAHQYGCQVLIDGAQSIAHISIDVKDLNADFYAFSAHKMYGPTGVGVLYGKYDLLCSMRPYQGGGAMIESVSFTQSHFLKPPLGFEAGTQAIAEVIGFASAVKFLQHIGFETIQKHDKALISYALAQIQRVKGVQLFTQEKQLIGSISFSIAGHNINDIGILLDKQHIMTRFGHHCAMPIMEKLGIEGTLRVSFGIYNTKEDVDRFIAALLKALEVLA